MDSHNQQQQWQQAQQQQQQHLVGPLCSTTSRCSITSSSSFCCWGNITAGRQCGWTGSHSQQQQWQQEQQQQQQLVVEPCRSTSRSSSSSCHSSSGSAQQQQQQQRWCGPCAVIAIVDSSHSVVVYCTDLLLEGDGGYAGLLIPQGCQQQQLVRPLSSNSTFLRRILQRLCC